MISEYTLLDMLGAVDRLAACVSNDSNRQYDAWRIRSRLQKELNECYGYRYAYRCDMAPVDDPKPELARFGLPAMQSMGGFMFYVELVGGDCRIDLRRFANKSNDPDTRSEIERELLNQLNDVVCGDGRLLPLSLREWYMNRKDSIPKPMGDCAI